MAKKKPSSQKNTSLYLRRKKLTIRQINCALKPRMCFPQPQSSFKVIKIDEGEIVWEIDNDVERVNIARGKGKILPRRVRSPFDLHSTQQLNEIIWLCIKNQNQLPK